VSPVQVSVGNQSHNYRPHCTTGAKQSGTSHIGCLFSGADTTVGSTRDDSVAITFWETQSTMGVAAVPLEMAGAENS